MRMRSRKTRFAYWSFLVVWVAWNATFFVDDMLWSGFYLSQRNVVSATLNFIAASIMLLLLVVSLNSVVREWHLTQAENTTRAPATKKEAHE